jgi:transketolase
VANVSVAVVNIDELCINTIRTLAIDAVQQANSGHPGTPMGMAPTVYALWQRLLRFDPEDPIWPNRDRSSSRDRLCPRSIGRNMRQPRA